MSDDINARLRSFFADNIGSEKAAALGPSDSLITSGILDSTRLLKLIAYAEETFGIDVPLQDLEPDNFASLEAMAKFIAAKMTMR